MKSVKIVFSIVGLLVILSSASYAMQQSIKPTSTTPPTVEAIDWEYRISYQRGIEAMNWAVPAVSMMSMRAGSFSLGGDYNTIYWIQYNLLDIQNPDTFSGNNNC